MYRIEISKYKKILIIIEKVMPINTKEQFVKSAIVSFFLNYIYIIKKDTEECNNEFLFLIISI